MSTPARELAHISVIGFDLDQTLYPRSPAVDAKIQAYILERIAAHREAPIEEAAQLFAERYRGGAGMTGTEVLAALEIPHGQAIVQEALERADIASTLAPDPETVRLVRDLKRRYASVDLITGSGYGQAVEKLAALSFTPADFGHLITADRASKSSGESFELWLSLYPELAPEEFFYVGDRIRSDHEVPAALGIRTALVYVERPDPALPALQLANLEQLRSFLL